MNKVLSEDYDNIAESIDIGKMRGSRILITGACGFIGSYLVELFVYLNDNYGFGTHIFAVDSHIAGKENRLSSLRGRHDLVLSHRDISERHSLNSLTSVDFIFNAASIASPAFYMRHPLQTMKVNAVGTWNVLEWATDCHPVSVLHFSSSEIYGDPTVLPTPETYLGFVSCNGSRSMYDESKRFSETLCMVYARDSNVPVKVVRPFNIYGPGQRLDDGRVIPSLVKAALTGQKFTIYGDGSATRSYCYISDAVIQMLAVMLSGETGETYNVGDGASEISLIDLVRVAAQSDVMPKFPGFEVFENSPFLKDAPTRRRPDTTKISMLVGKPQVGLKEGLRRTLTTYESK